MADPTFELRFRARLKYFGDMGEPLNMHSFSPELSGWLAELQERAARKIGGAMSHSST